MIKKTLAIAAAATCMVAMSLQARASINVTPMISHVKPGKSRVVTLNVTNEDETNKAYVQLIPEKLENPGQDNQKFVGSEGKTPREFGLIVHPRKIALKPGQRRPVRVTVVNPNVKQDQIFGVDVKPVGNTAATDVKVSSGGSSSAAQVHLNIAYRPMVVVLPKNPKPELSIKRDGKKLELANTGNTTVNLSYGKQCVKDKCQSLKDHVVYPGTKQTVSLPMDAPVQFKQRSVVGTSEVSTS